MILYIGGFSVKKKKKREWDAERSLILGEHIFRLIFALVIIILFGLLMYFFGKMFEVQTSLFKLITGIE